MARWIPYNRRAAVAYAHRWAFGRNPEFYSFNELGGDCTNFASQCLYAGTGVMNFTPDLGWYYRSGNDKAPAWTGVPYFYNFLTRSWDGPGPVGEEMPLAMLEPGDFVQLRFAGSKVYGHTPIVVAVRNGRILVAAHSQDADYRPLSTYSYVQARGIHILGAREI